MELERPNPISKIMLFKKELWIREYSTRMQKWLEGEQLPPIRIDAELHRRCNLNCIHCIRRQADHDIDEHSRRIEVPSKRWIEIARESGRMKVKAWNIAGIGEPMCTPRETMALLKTIKQQNIFGELTTNGTLWDDHDIKSLVQIGWDSIAVSIDAPVADIHDRIRRVPGTFEKAVNMVRKLRKYRDQYAVDRPAITINMVLNSLNYKHLPDMIRMVHDIGADAIFVEPMIVHSELGQEAKLTGKELRKLPRLIEKAEALARKLNIGTFITCMEGEDDKKEFNRDMIDKTSDIKDVIKKNIERQKTVTETRHKIFRVKEHAVKEETLQRIFDIPCYYPWFFLMITAEGTTVHCGECKEESDNIKNKSLEGIWLGPNLTKTRQIFLDKTLPDYCRMCRPNVINDMCLVRKSIKEYAQFDKAHTNLVNLFRENLELKEEIYYLKTGKEPPKEKRKAWEEMNIFRF